jgi:hypothetical protein
MGSFGDEYSHPRLHKRFDLGDNKAYILAAGSIDKAAELVPAIDRALSAVPPDKRTYGDILQAVSMSCFRYKMERFIREVHPKHGIPPETYDPFKASKDVLEILDPEWRAFEVGVDLLVGAFSHTGQAHLIVASGDKGTADGVGLPGFSAIGSGFPNAMYWLSHRAHTLGMKPLRALYHAYEAKIMAEDTPTVNDHIDILVANASGKWWFSSHFKQEALSAMQLPDIPTVSLREMFKEYGPQPTDKLDEAEVELIKRSGARTSAGQR